MKKFLGLTSLACASIFAFNVLGTSSASAATPPDSCFAFSGGTITDYYANENNNSANPACPRDVDIPSTIGGVTVTNIGASAFSWDYTSDATKLTAVTIPNTVTNIDGYAFVNNKLTTITIPDAVATIGSGAFRSNQLSNVIVEGVLSSVADGVLTNNVITTLTYNGTTYTAPTGNTTPPDSCFAFNAGIITDYYYADLRQIANGGSVCLARDITIPGSIGGVAVTSLGTRGAYFGPFANKSLVNVIIPNSVTTIGSQAFFSISSPMS